MESRPNIHKTDAEAMKDFFGSDFYLPKAEPMIRKATLTADFVHHQARMLPVSFQAPLLLSSREDSAYVAALAVAATSKMNQEPIS